MKHIALFLLMIGFASASETVDFNRDIRLRGQLKILDSLLKEEGA